MAREIKYYIVAANALPEIFVKVAEAKRMMQTGEGHRGRCHEAGGGSAAARFYKYKDAVQPFNDMKAEHIITFYCMLRDNTGVPPACCPCLPLLGPTSSPSTRAFPPTAARR